MKSPLRGSRLFWMGVMAFFLALLAAVYLAYFRDCPPPADDDLLLARVEVPPEENGFHALQGAEEVWRGDSEETGGQVTEELRERWDAGRARRILERNAGILARLERAMALRAFQVPLANSFFEDIVSLGWQSMVVSLGWQSMAGLVVVKALDCEREGRPVEALDEGLKLVRFGHRIQGAGGTLPDYMVGLSIKRWGLETVRNLLPDHRLGEADLQRALALLGECPGHVEGFGAAFRNEYRLQKALLEAVATGTKTLEEILSGHSGHEPWHVRALPLLPNRTKALIGNAHRAVIKALPEPMNRYPFLSGGHGSWVPAWVPVPNSPGRYLQRALLAVADGMWIDRWVSDGTRVLVALRIHEIRMGSLPERLDALVPAILPAVPVDPLDGAPLRYSREKRIVWSVGWDSLDSGGSLPSYGWDTKEPTLTLAPPR